VLTGGVWWVTYERDRGKAGGGVGLGPAANSVFMTTPGEEVPR
jgi:hypothetical protein